MLPIPSTKGLAGADQSKASGLRLFSLNKKCTLEEGLADEDRRSFTLSESGHLTHAFSMLSAFITFLFLQRTSKYFARRWESLAAALGPLATAAGLVRLKEGFGRKGSM